MNLCVGSPDSKEARSRDQQSNKKMSWKAADVRKECICDRTFGPVRTYCRMPRLCWKYEQHTEECQARIEQEVVDKGDAMKLETSGNQEEIVQELDVSLKKRKIGEPDINPGGGSSVTANSPKRRGSEQGSSARSENLLAVCIAAVNKLLSHAICRDELKIGREFELRNMWNFDAFELVDELPPGKYACDVFCVRQFQAEGLRDDLFAGTPDTSKYHQVPPNTTKY